MPLFTQLLRITQLCIPTCKSYPLMNILSSDQFVNVAFPLFSARRAALKRGGSDGDGQRARDGQDGVDETEEQHGNGGRKTKEKEKKYLKYFLSKYSA